MGQPISYKCYCLSKGSYRYQLCNCLMNSHLNHCKKKNYLLSNYQIANDCHCLSLIHSFEANQFTHLTIICTQPNFCVVQSTQYLRKPMLLFFNQRQLQQFHFYQNLVVVLLLNSIVLPYLPESYCEQASGFVLSFQPQLKLQLDFDCLLEQINKILKSSRLCEHPLNIHPLNCTLTIIRHSNACFKISASQSGYLCRSCQLFQYC